ncbi:MAG: DUF6062 family protein, partial [Chloroflexota bacterium]
MTKQQQAARHTTYYELLAAVQSDDCPLCALGLRSAQRYLRSLAYEHVNDLDLRAGLRARRGFCNHHAWQMVLEESDGLAVAIIYRDVVQNLIRPLEAHGAPRWPGPLARLLGRPEPDLLSLLAPRGECPACRARDEAVERYLGALGEHWHEPPLRAAWWHSAGLCLPHLRQALAAPETAALADDLLLPTRQRLARLASEGDLPALAALLVGRGGTQTHRPPSGQAAALPPENEARLPVAGLSDEDAAAD